ncbi:MAG: hypothetical protein WD749_02850 [Phycisphaerales bacterium]
MSSAPIRQEDDPNRPISVANYAVALVDVLNQRQALMQWAVVTEDDKPGAEFLAKLKATVGRILDVRKMLRDYVEGFAERNLPPQDVWSTLPESMRQEYLAFSTSNLRMQSFSDTAILYAPMRAHRGEPLMKDVYGIIGGVAMLIPGLLSVGVAARGAIEIGAGTGDAFEGQIYGPCLAMAHHLESGVADYPRVVIGPHLNKYLRGFAARKPKDPWSALSWEMANEIRNSFVANDDDGRPIVDFLGPGMRQQREAMKPFVHRAFAFVQRERDRFKRDGNKKLEDRYARLLRYFELRMASWAN